MGVYISDENGQLKKYSGTTRAPKTIATGLPLGLIIPAAIVSDDTNLQLLDGSCIAQNGMYAEFCAWLKSRINANASNVPTCTIAEYATEMTTYGQCGKFVINDGSSDLSSNGYTAYANSIKLPTITEFIASNNGGDSIGLAELDMFKGHSHYINTRLPEHVPVQGGYRPSDMINHFESDGYWSNSGMHTTWEGGEETRPKNVRYPYYIVVATGLKLAVVANMDGVTNDIKNINNTLNKTEQVEVIYDMLDSTKDWGYSGGIVDGARIYRDFSKYKKLIFYTWGYPNGTSLIIDTHSTRDDNGTMIKGAVCRYVLYDTEAGLFSYSLEVDMPLDLSSVHISLIRRQFSNGNAISQGRVSKIEGVY